MPTPTAATSTPQPQPLDDQPAGDLVDRIFELLATHPRMPAIPPRELFRVKAEVRAEFAGTRQHVRRVSLSAGAADVLALFNGRNATEVARHLNISRATVYRVLKQHGTRRHTAAPAVWPQQAEAAPKPLADPGA